MKKETLVQKIRERFSNYQKDIAVVVDYKGTTSATCPMHINGRFFEEKTIEQIKPFYYGEIIEEKQELCGNPEFQYLTYRAECANDIFNFGYHCYKNQEDIMFDSFNNSEGIFVSITGRLVAPSNLSLIEVKELMWKIVEKYNIPDVHILIQSVDYPVFCGLRDRNSPNP